MALIVAPEEIINHRFRSGPSGEKDHLDNDAARAAALGLSYGKYKALEREGLLPTKDLPTQEEGTDKPAPPEIITGPVRRRQVRVNYPLRPCEQCGKEYKPHAINSKYCCDHCRNLAWAARDRAKKKARNAQAKEAKA